MRSLKDAEKEGKNIAAKLHAEDLKLLRAIPADELQQKTAGFYSPIVDGYIMPMSVADAYRKNKQMKVPLLTGWNGDEGFMFGVLSKETFAQQSKDFGADSNLFKKYFPSDNDSSSLTSQISLSVAKTMGVSEYAWVSKQSAGMPGKTFLYVFTRKPPAQGDKKKFGAYHTAEIGYALHNLDSIQRLWTPLDDTLQTLMSAYWVQFVKTGNPNRDGLPVWGSFSL